MKRLFGTDGVRGVAGEWPLDPPTVRRLGVALARELTSEAATGRVVLGRDTRESGPWMRDAFAAGLTATGRSAIDAGVISTPGLAHIVAACGFDAGVMISASHNPFMDNGLKIFGPDGRKLVDSTEARIESAVLDEDGPDPGPRTDAVYEDPSLVARYIAHLEALLPATRPFAGLRLALDCANGSAVTLAPEIVRYYGAEVITLGDAPDGRNINLDCGSLHLERLRRVVCEQGLDLGLAFDGDADRVLAVDRRGRIADGDHVLYLTARLLRRSGRLDGDAVVATILSNLWLEQRLAQEGIALRRAPVGDKYVLEAMRAEDLALGGEQSGHVIFRDYGTTGDGILSGLLLLEALRHEGRRLDEILDTIVPCPQVQFSVRVRQKPELRNHPRIAPVIASVERELAGTGRVVLRYSGTEPVARIMVEGLDGELVRRQAERLRGLLEDELGA